MHRSAALTGRKALGVLAAGIAALGIAAAGLAAPDAAASPAEARHGTSGAQAAAGLADLAVSSAPRAPGAVRPRARFSLRVVVGNRGRARVKRSRLSIFLSPDRRHGADDRLIGTAKVRALRPRGRTRVTVRVRLPGDLPLAQPRHLVACVKPVGKVRERRRANNCRTLPGRAAALSGATHDMIDRAEALRLITGDEAVAYRIFAAFDQRRLPSAYRGATGRGETTEAMAHARKRLRRMTPGLRRQVQPYLIPPIYRGSFGDRWAGKRKPRKRKRGRASALDGDHFDQCRVRLGGWDSVAPARTPVRVWWRTDRTSDEMHAKRLAQQLEAVIWPRLTGLMGRPVSDETKFCSGIDGSVDVYLHPLSSAGAGATSQFDAFCGRSPAWIVVHPAAPAAVLAHEFMHVLQYAHERSKPCEKWSYLHDATAVWAEGYAYPAGEPRSIGGRQSFAAGHRTAHDYLHMLDDPTVLFGYGPGYPGWVFFKSVTEGEKSPAAIKALYAAAGKHPPLRALDAALPGGLEKQWPAFARNGWNRYLDSALTESFFSWEGLSNAPRAPSQPMALKGDEERHRLHIALSGLSRQYRAWDFSDPAARRIAFHDPSDVGGRAGLHADAFVKTADGKWRHEDWTGKGRIEFCRDEAAQDVREVVLVHSTTTLPPEPDVTKLVVDTDRPALELFRTCGDPGAEGEVKVSYRSTESGNGYHVETRTDVTYHMRLDHRDEDTADYDGPPVWPDAGTTYTGTHSQVTTFDGGGSACSYREEVTGSYNGPQHENHSLEFQFEPDRPSAPSGLDRRALMLVDTRLHETWARTYAGCDGSGSGTRQAPHETGDVSIPCPGEGHQDVPWRPDYAAQATKRTDGVWDLDWTCSSSWTTDDGNGMVGQHHIQVTGGMVARTR